MNDASGAPLQELLAAAVKNDKRLTAFLSPDFHVLPAQLRSNPSAKGLRDGLFRREARREERSGEFVAQAIRNLCGPEDARDKAFAEPFIRSFDALHFDDVDARAKNHRATLAGWNAGMMQGLLLSPDNRA